jgi:mannose-1-phosphate guanylyltransferase/mannose-1-phosphate guanylyltransferase/phosphomannomutase
MVMAAGLGTRLRPLTDHLPKPMVPVANRPVLEHLFRRLLRSGVDGVIVNLHYHADAIRGYFGDGTRLGLPIEYSFEEELMGTAGGTRRCGWFLTAEDDCFLVTSADGLHDVDVGALVEQHRGSDAVATLAVKRVPETEQFGVVVTDADGRVTAFQEKPPREEARSDLANLGIYVFDHAVLDRIPADTFYDFGKQVLPELVRDGLPMRVYETDAYWSDVGSVEELVAGNLAAVADEIGIELAGEEVRPGVFAAEGVRLDDATEIAGPVLIGRDATLAARCEVTGPAVIGPGCTIGTGAGVRRAVLLPGTTVPSDGLVAGGVVGDATQLAETWRRWPVG